MTIEPNKISNFVTKALQQNQNFKQTQKNYTIFDNDTSQTKTQENDDYKQADELLDLTQEIAKEVSLNERRRNNDKNANQTPPLTTYTKRPPQPIEDNSTVTKVDDNSINGGFINKDNSLKENDSYKQADELLDLTNQDIEDILSDDEAKEEETDNNKSRREETPFYNHEENEEKNHDDLQTKKLTKTLIDSTNKIAINTLDNIHEQIKEQEN